VIAPTEATYSAPQVCDMVGITYRQLDYWLRRRIITIGNDHTPGSGHHRLFTESEVVALTELVAIYNSARAILRDFGSGDLWADAMEKEGHGEQ
jgi:hypothetical protein